MRKITLAFAFLLDFAAIAAIAPSPAAAGVTFTAAYVPQPGQQSIEFADQVNAGSLTGTGSLDATDTLTIFGQTTTLGGLNVGGGTILAASGDIIELVLSPNTSLSGLSFDVIDGSGELTYTILTSDSQVFTFSTAISAGNNFATIAADSGTGIQSVTLSFNGPGSFNSFRGVTASFGESPPAVPEPRSWAMMLLGFGAIGFILRRRRNRSTVFA